jgi:hypothetical protein
LGVPDRKLPVATAVVAHLDAAGHTVAVEWHEPPG